MASKLFTSFLYIFLFLFLFLFSSSLSTIPVAARPVPGFSNAFLGTSRVGVVDDVLEEESCDEIGEEYCLMRKTLAAHVDYIYTDSQKP